MTGKAHKCDSVVLHGGADWLKVNKPRILIGTVYTLAPVFDPQPPLQQICPHTQTLCAHWVRHSQAEKEQPLWTLLDPVLRFCSKFWMMVFPTSKAAVLLLLFVLHGCLANHGTSHNTARKYTLCSGCIGITVHGEVLVWFGRIRIICL